MKNKFPCELIQDLFPSYIDKLTSEVTNAIVEEHVSQCETCKNILDTMVEPQSPAVSYPDREEIDFLKKTRRKTHKIILACILLSVLAVTAVLAAKLFFIGNEIYSENVACEVKVEGKHLSLSGVVADEILGISSVEYKESGGVVTVSFRAVRKSPFHKGEFQSEYEAQEDITQVCLDERIIWSRGKSISAIASAVYNTRHPYVGDMPANGRTALALNIANYLGNYTNELQTTAEPYGWKMIFQEEIPASQQEKRLESMKAYAYVLLSVIDNLGEVSYEYTMDGQVRSVTVTAKEATTFAGQDIKECGQDVVLLQELIEKTGLNAYAYVSDSSQWHTQDTIQIEIVNNTDADLSSVALSYFIDGTLYGTQTSANADGTAMEKGATLYFTFIPDDFGSAKWEGETEITMEASVYDEAGNCYQSSAFYVAAEFGAIYNYTLSGNADDGYVVSQ